MSAGSPPAAETWASPEEAAAERARLASTERALLNILEDFAAEKDRLEDTQRAVMNILDDLALEKARLESAQAELLRSEQAIRRSLREKEVLLKEIHHRVKNNLQVISSLMNLQARHLSDPTARQFFAESQSRVRSIALVHEKLYRSADLSHVDFADYVTTLVEQLFFAHDADERHITRSLALGGTHLGIDLAIPCGLIVNELVTNCLKHAFRGRERGHVEVRARPAAGGLVELSIADDGVGLPRGFDPRATDSLGLDLVFTFAEQIDATVEIASDVGTTFRFCFKTPGGSP